MTSGLWAVSRGGATVARGEPKSQLVAQNDHLRSETIEWRVGGGRVSNEADRMPDVPEPLGAPAVRLPLASGPAPDWKHAAVGESNRLTVPEKTAR
jgi:hypothetical protein